MADGNLERMKTIIAQRKAAKAYAAEAGPAPGAKAETPKPPPPGKPAAPGKKKDDKPQGATVVTYRCGHSESVGRFKGQPCGECRKVIRRERAERHKQRNAERKAKSADAKMARGRLPHGSEFHFGYDAETQTWGGRLVVPGRDELTARSTGVNKLLRVLDDLYRGNPPEGQK